MMEKNILGEKSPVRVQLGFLIQIVVVIIGMVYGYQAIQYDLKAATRASQDQQGVMQAVLVSLESIKIDIRIQQQKLDDLKMLYDRDFNTYFHPPQH